MRTSIFMFIKVNFLNLQCSFCLLLPNFLQYWIILFSNNFLILRSVARSFSIIMKDVYQLVTYSSRQIAFHCLGFRQLAFHHLAFLKLIIYTAILLHGQPSVQLAFYVFSFLLIYLYQLYAVRPQRQKEEKECELRIFLLKSLLNAVCFDLNRDAPCQMCRRNSQSAV